MSRTESKDPDAADGILLVNIGRILEHMKSGGIIHVVCNDGIFGPPTEHAERICSPHGIKVKLLKPSHIEQVEALFCEVVSAYC